MRITPFTRRTSHLAASGVRFTRSFGSHDNDSPKSSIFSAISCATAGGKAIDISRAVTRFATRFLTLAAMVALGSGHVGAQTVAAPPTAPAATFRSGVEVVTVTAAVRDERGRVVRNLTKADFQVID